MSKTPEPASKSFDTAAHISLKLAAETIDIIFANGITDQTADAAFKVIDKVAAQERTDVALYIVEMSWWKNQSVRDIARQKALEHLNEVPQDMFAAKSFSIFKKIPIETEMKERTFVTVLGGLRALEYPAAIEQSYQFKNDIYHDSLVREPTPEIISHKTRAVSLIVDLLEKYPDYPYLKNIAGNLVRDVIQVDPEKKEDLLRRLEIISPKNSEAHAAKDIKAGDPPTARPPSTEAQRLAQELLGPNLK